MSGILVIDDERLVRSLMVELLERAGYDVLESESALSALELLDDARVSLVVSDVRMPGLSGFELLREVQLRRPSLPVLLVTGAGAEDALGDALERGAAGLLLKPFSASDLCAQVGHVLGQAAGDASAAGRRALRSSVAARDRA